MPSLYLDKKENLEIIQRFKEINIKTSSEITTYVFLYYTLNNIFMRYYLVIGISIFLSYFLLFI